MTAIDLMPFAEETSTEDDKEIFDFSSPEDILIEVVMHDPADPADKWANFSIESTTIINGKEGVTGAASYEESYGGFLDYTIQGMIEPPGEGWFVVQCVTGVYTKGDGWMTDDDMDFYHAGVRPATPEEIAQA